MTDDLAPVSPDEARAQLALTSRPLEVTRRDRVLVAAGVAGSGVVLAVTLVWLVPLTVTGSSRRSLAVWLCFGFSLILLNFIRTHARSTPYDTGRLVLVSSVLGVPAIVVGLLVANLAPGPELLREVVGAAIIALPSLAIGRRIMRGRK